MIRAIFNQYFKAVIHRSGLLLCLMMSPLLVLCQKYELQLMDSVVEKDSAKVLFNLNRVWLTQSGVWENVPESQSLENDKITIDVSIIHPVKKIGKRIEISSGGNLECMCENKDSIFLFNGIQVFVYDKTGAYAHKSSKLKLKKSHDNQIFGEDSKHISTSQFHSGCKELEFEVCEYLNNTKSYRLATWKYDTENVATFPDPAGKSSVFQHPFIFNKVEPDTAFLISSLFDNSLCRYDFRNDRIIQTLVQNVAVKNEESILFSENWGDLISLDSTTCGRIKYYPIASRKDNPFAYTEQEYYAKSKELEVRNLASGYTQTIRIPERLEFIGNLESTLYFRNLFPGTIYVFQLIKK